MSSQSNEETGNDVRVPLVVDVDGTLVSGDLLIEGLARFLAASPLRLLALPFWLARGRATLKRRIARAVSLPPATLVLNPAVLDEIASAKAVGREIWLASASDEISVAPLAEAVGAAGCLASDGRTNLAGQAKAAVLVERFGEGGFDYIGNERRDMTVWKHARRAIGVALSASLALRVRSLDEKARFLPGLGGGPPDYVRALRPHQWVKNVLVFAPLIAAHETQPWLYAVTAAVFVALSACASGTYLLNDLLDLPYDRQHTSKRQRPMAAGKVPLLPMMGTGAVLVTGGLGLAFSLSLWVGLCVLGYLIASLAYSLLIKRQVFLDVVTLALLYAVRVFAGATAASTPLSPWFLAFFLFVFLTLAVVKRQHELRTLHQSGGTNAAGRAYAADDLGAMTALAAGSGLAAVVVFSLYIQSSAIHELYSRPAFLWAMYPLLLYWMGRITLLANRGAIADDPVVFTMRDRVSWLTGLCVLTAFAAAV